MLELFGSTPPEALELQTFALAAGAPNADLYSAGVPLMFAADDEDDFDDEPDDDEDLDEDDLDDDDDDEDEDAELVDLDDEDDED